MNTHRYQALLLPLVLVTAFAGLLLAQGTDENPPQAVAPEAQQNAPQKMLVVNGKEMPNAVAEMDGHYYVTVDSLAQITNGQLSIEPSRIVLVTPSAAPSAPAQAAPEAPPQVMTRDFARVALSALAEMREWKAAVATIVSFGAPVVGTWPDDYRDRVQAGVSQSQVAAVSEEDQDALALLENEADSLMAWSDQVISARQSLNAEQNVTPNALGSDLLYQKISKCAEFLNGMLGSGVFQDDPNCH